MANRPVFIPTYNPHQPGVEIKHIDFQWFPGMSKSQKQKSIHSLHDAANTIAINNLLEISSKSEIDTGVKLSAFNLMISTPKNNREFSVETAFQSSKVFTQGGPYTDLLSQSSLAAKKDIRLKESGGLTGFVFFNRSFALKPRTFFYDWLYINALHKNKKLSKEILNYQSFTDIEFNPKKSINCQAYSAALYLSLIGTNKIDEALSSPESFKKTLSTEYSDKDDHVIIQGTLL